MLSLPVFPGLTETTRLVECLFAQCRSKTQSLCVLKRALLGSLLYEQIWIQVGCGLYENVVYKCRVLNQSCFFGCVVLFFFEVFGGGVRVVWLCGCVGCVGVYVGLSSALDVHMTAPLASADPCGPQLHRASLAKAARYHTHPDGPLPGALTCVPLTMCATLPFLHVSSLRLLHRLLRDIASRSLSPWAATWGVHFARVTREVTASLSHAFALGAFRQFPACVGPSVN